MIYYSPRKVDKYVEIILDKIDAEFDPEIIPIITEEYSKPLNCYLNVDKKVQLAGGNPHYGWAILKGEFICEAERHAVWETPDSELVDITPRENFPYKEIMFVSDNDFKYVGQLIDNIRVNVTKNRVVDHVISACENVEFFYRYGNRVNDDQLLIEPEIGKYIFEYEGLKKVLFSFLESKGNENRNCICGSLKSYRNCHGIIMIKKMEEDKKFIKEKYGLPIN